MGIYAEPRGVSVGSKAGLGFLTNGKLLNFTKGFPNASTTLWGIDLTLQFEGYVEDGLGDAVDTNGQPTGEVGQLVLSYYQGTADETLTQDDLPLSGPLADLVEFSLDREIEHHMGLVEWRWPSNKPVYQTRFLDGIFELTFIDPWFGLGSGAMRSTTTVTRDGTREDPRSAWSFLVTGATGGDLAELAYHSPIGEFSLKALAEARLFAGNAFGLFGVGGGQLTYQWR